MAFKPEEHRIQAYLLANAEELILRVGREDSKDLLTAHGLSPSIARGPQPVYVKKVAKDPASTGDNFSDLFNSFSSSGSVDFVTDLPTAVRKKLKPAVRIFKTIREPSTGKELDLELKSSVSNDAGEGVSLQAVEIVRLGGNPEEVDTNIKVSITLYSTALGRFFDKQEPIPLPNWKVDSKNVVPGVLTKAAESGVSWIDLLKIDLGGEKENIERYLQAIGKKPKSSIVKEFGSVLSMNEIDQRIKIELSYRDIEKVEGYSPEEVKTINSWISSQKEVLYLSLLEHEIGFNENGTSTMRINYIGSGATNTFSRVDDILFDPYLYELELQWNDDICKLNAALGDDDKRERMVVGLNSNPFGEERGSDETTLRGRDTKTEEEKKEAIRQREAWIDDIRVGQSQLMLSGLYGFTKMFTSSPGGEQNAESLRNKIALVRSLGAKRKSRVYVNQVRMSDITGNISLGLSKKKDGSGILGVGNYTDYFLAMLEKGKVDRRKASEERTATDTDRTKKEKDLQTSLEVKDVSEAHSSGGSWSGTDDDSAMVQFVFLGDIIETAIEVLASNRRFGSDESFESKYFKPSPDIRRIKGMGIKGLRQAFVTPFYAYRESPQITTATLLSKPVANDVDKILKRVYEEYGEILFSDIIYQNPANPNEQMTISLADVPISFFDYRNWYIENFVAKRRSTLYLKQFIEMLISNYVPNLFAKAKRKAGETTDKEKPILLINRETLPVEKHAFLQAITGEGPFPLNALRRDKIRNEFQQNKLQSLANSDVKLGQLMIISQAPVVNLKPSANQTRRQLNKLKNIPNIIFNDPDAGIFETLTFQKEDMPGLREARLFEGKNFVGPNIIREKYNCSLMVKGTTFFKPGSIFYLDPAPLDLGFAVDGKSPARMLGLGGYYDVIRLTHNIDLDFEEWQTNLETKWKSFGEDDGVKRNKNADKCETSLKSQLASSLDISDPKAWTGVFSQKNINRSRGKKPKP
jgi:hypothetical protein